MSRRSVPRGRGGGFGGSLDGDAFGDAVAATGDLDENGVPELAVGAVFDDGNGSLRGAVWVLFGEQSLLPVEMAGLTAEGSGNATHMTWQTASETNNAGFEVQRKAGSGAGWQQVGFVESKAEGGTTTKHSHTVLRQRISPSAPISSV